MAYYYTIAQVAAGSQPIFVTLQQAKDHLKIDHDYEDGLITALIQAALAAAENYTSTSFLHRVVTIETDCFPKSLPLEHGPLRNPDLTITYFDAANDQQNYESEYYTIVYGYGKKPELLYISQNNLPQVYNRHDAVTFQLNLGYEETLPTPLYQAVLLTLSDFYEYREDRKEITSTKAMALMRPYKKWA